jgi:hypothetical protein
MSTKYATPLVSPTERELIERSKRMNAPALPPLLVYTAGAPVQLPLELSTRLIHKRRTVPVVDFTAVPSIVLHEEDVDDELEASLLGTATA